MEIPMIRDMTARCKCCGGYFYAKGINKDGLCHRCESGIAACEAYKNDDDNARDWDDF